jgi:hypothetical protein
MSYDLASSNEANGCFECSDCWSQGSGRRDWCDLTARRIDHAIHNPSAKNVVLAGVKSVTIYDPEPVTVQDLGTQVSYRHSSDPTGFDVFVVLLATR